MFWCGEAKWEKFKSRQSPCSHHAELKPRTPASCSFSCQCSTTGLWPPDNHQPSQSSICTTQVVYRGHIIWTLLHKTGILHCGWTLRCLHEVYNVLPDYFSSTGVRWLQLSWKLNALVMSSFIEPFLLLALIHNPWVNAFNSGMSSQTLIATMMCGLLYLYVLFTVALLETCTQHN